MKNKVIMMAAAVAALVGFSASVQATPITGSIGFAGSFTSSGALNSPNDTITFGPSVVIGVITGSFASFVSDFDVISTSPITINPLALPVNSLWSVGGFTFDLTGGSNISNAAGAQVDGTGTISGNGFDSTMGNWIATFNDSGANFTWSASTSSAPDGGTTVGLLGLALAVCGVFARKLKHV